MPLTLMYITNKPEVALIAEKYGVERIWIDLETLGKEERQKGLNSVKSKHTISDIRRIKPLLTKAQLLVRINPWNAGSIEEINAVISAGADMIMLPMWKSADEVKQFLKAINKRVKTTLLLETKEAVSCLDIVLKNGGMDEIHIGLNDLHLSYGLSFMFEPLVNGIVDNLASKIAAAGIPFGFGGIARLGYGDLPAEKVILEHYRLGSTRAILSRSFCNSEGDVDISIIDKLFSNNLAEFRAFEKKINQLRDFSQNHHDVELIVQKIVSERGGVNDDK